MDIHLDCPGYGDNINIFGGYTFNTKYGNVPAYCLNETRTIIKDILKNIYNGIFVEIGVFGGSTLLDIYDTCQTNNNLIYGIDPYEKIKIFNGIDYDNTNDLVKTQEINRYRNIRINLNNIIKNNNLSLINVLHDESWSVYNNFGDNSIDCIHIDGDHSYNGVNQDLTLYWNKIKSGGIIINDDYHWNGVKKAIDEFVLNNNSDILKHYPILNGEKYIIFKK